MRRIDRYWKRCAAGVMAALTLMLGQGTMQSFAMNAKVVTSPNKIIVQDETQNTDDQNNNGTQNVVSKAEVAGFEKGDGGLIVVDGGWTDNTDYVLNQIKAKGGHVQAWLITHPDSDHAGAIADILYKHAGEITIDGIYYSFLEDSWYAEKDANVASMVAYIKGAFAKVSPSILHGDIVAGQVINAGPAKIQVLNQAYKENNDFVNNSSVAYMVSLNGTNVVFLGDLGNTGGEHLMQDVNLAALKCKMVQMSHHGQNGVGYEVYKALRPSVCLWPTPQWLWDNDNGGGAGSGSWKTQETRNWMTRLGVKEYYVTKDGDQVIE